ncbi:TRAP transporter small permease [Endozoicomonadaceae bacterium StTr2]
MSLSAWVRAHYDEAGPVRWLAFALEVVAAVVLFLLMVMTCIDVGGRYLFNNSVDGVTELTELALAIMLFAEMPVMTWRGGHVVVDMLDKYLGSVVIKVLGLVAAFAISTSMYFLGVRIFQLAERSLRRGVVTEYLELPTGYIVQYIATMSWVTAFGMISYGIYRIITSGESRNTEQ